MDEPQSNQSSVPLYFRRSWPGGKTVVSRAKARMRSSPGRVVCRHACHGKLAFAAGDAARGGAAKSCLTKGKNFLLKCSERPEDYFSARRLYSRRRGRAAQPAYKNGPLAHELAAPFYARVKGQDEVTKKQYLDMNMWLPGDILLKADKMCMAHSLELRVPFLDKKVLEFAETVPVDYRIQGTDTKIVMRHAANKTLPDEWANRPKKGFPVPIRYWLREEKYYNIVKEYFTSDYAAVFFKPDALMKLLDDHFHERANNQRKIWTVFTFLVWYKRFFVDEK
ncbi:MAG: asparagine synthase-related protein [Ruthenibacterium lactatiformans]